MNTPTQQAELYRKAAETIEMCSPHGIEPIIKMSGCKFVLDGILFNCDFDRYEFPITVIEGQLVWADTIVYNCHGHEINASYIKYSSLPPFSLTPPKQPLCSVEGKPVYKGDKLWNVTNNFMFTADTISATGIWDKPCIGMRMGARFEDLSWNPPKRTVMVELLVDDAESIANYWDGSWTHNDIAQRTTTAIRKSLDNLK